MSGRLNPREYNLGELRDAVQELSHPRATGNVAEYDQVPTDGGSAVPIEPAGTGDPHTEDAEAPRREPTQLSEEGAETPTDNVESYLRSRHRRRREPTDPPRRERNAGQTHRKQEQPTQQRAQNPDTFLAELSGSHLTKPYLERVPDAYSAQLEVFEWIDQMLSRAGQEATVSALEYYEAIGWLSEQSREELEEITAGFSTADATGRRLDINDHRESLLYVARLSHRLNK